MDTATSTGRTKAAGIAGWLFLIGVIVSNVLRGQPIPNDAPIADILTSYQDNQLLPITHSIAIFNLLVLLIYASGLFRRLRSDASEIWARVGLSAATVLTLSFSLVVISDAVLADLATSFPDSTAAIMAVFKIHAAAFVANAAILGMAMIGFGVAARITNAYSGWLAMLAMIGGALLMIGALPIDAVIGGSMFGMIGFAGFILWLVWLGVTSTKMMKGN